MSRTDDRPGADPYDLAIGPDGTVRFNVERGRNDYSRVYSDPLPIGVAIHIAGTLDGETGEQRLYINGELVDSKVTDIRPIGELDPAYEPGVTIASSTTDNYGNETFPGQIAEVRIASIALEPENFLFQSS